MKQVTNSSGTNWVINYSSIFWFSVSVSCSCSNHFTIKHVRIRNHFRKQSYPLWSHSAETFHQLLIELQYGMYSGCIKVTFSAISDNPGTSHTAKIHTGSQNHSQEQQIFLIRDAHGHISSISLRLPEDRCTYFPGRIILANPLTARRQN